MAQSQSTAVADIAQRADAYNMPGVIVDGQDVLAVHEAVSLAVACARAGHGPTLVEAKTYRYREHAEFGGFKLPMYRSEAEIATWRARDPLEIIRGRLRLGGDLSDEEFDQLQSVVLAEVDAAVLFAQQSPAPTPQSLLEDLFI
jgi:pyruvate dehydrogenase E1 component alpha subunit